MEGAHFPLQAVPNRARLPLVGHDAEDLLRLQDLAHRHRNRPLGHLFDPREPALAHLLPAAGLVEANHEVGLFGLEVGRRIVERQVAVLADAHEGHVDRTCREKCRPPDRASASGVGSVAGDEVKGPGMDAGDDPFAEVAAEAGRVDSGKAHVLVEVEEHGLRPVDPVRRGERIQELELGGPGGGDHVCAARPCDRFAQDRAGLGRGGPRHLRLGVERPDLHVRLP